MLVTTACNAFSRHLDTNNSGWSYLVTKGCFTGGRVWVEREDGEERATRSDRRWLFRRLSF